MPPPPKVALSTGARPASTPASGAEGRHTPAAFVVDVQVEPAAQPLPPVPRQPMVQVLAVALQMRPIAQSVSLAQPQFPDRHAPPAPVGLHAASLPVAHSTHARAAEHTSPFAQSPSTVHSTQAVGIAWASQWTKGLAVQSESIAQGPEHTWVVGLHAVAFGGQSAEVRQPQVLVATMQAGFRPLQCCASAPVHSTHVFEFP